jgi:NADH:ubiquinone oxidoreductase subunit 5 (subunit L)/multisubunit Na+/H+ antiporter MnhA subunit
MNSVLIAISLPFLGAFFGAFFPKKYKPNFSVVILGLTFLFSLHCLSQVARYKELSFLYYLNSWLSLYFICDGLGVFMAVVSSFVALLISFYSLEYMRQEAQRSEFYFWMLLFVGAMLGLIFSANLILMFCFWEMTSVCSWRLIGFYRRDKDLKAADRAFLVTFFGASLMLIGIVLVYLNYGTLEISLLKDKPLTNLVAFLFLAGIISKSAQLPLQTWLADAGVAPTPVTALLHAAVLVKIGVYVFARLFSLTFSVSALFLNSVILVSAITIIVGGCCALVENNMKRILAYSTISQLGYIILAFALNSLISLKVALIYILAHSLAKAGLFLCAGIIEHKTGTKDISRLGGLSNTMPYTALAYILCAFSIIGIPPFLGFWPKFMTILLAFQARYFWVGILAVIGALLTLFYLMRLFDKLFLGQEQIIAKEEKNSWMLYVVLLLGAVSLTCGLGIKVLFNLLASIIK